MAATKRQLDKRLTEIGYVYDGDEFSKDDLGFWTYSLYAPSGLRFSTGLHSMCGSADTKAEMFGEILDRIGEVGLVPCDNVPCDGCERYEDE